MICTNCRNEVPDNAKVCGYCGHRLKEPVQPAIPLRRQDETRPKTPSWIWGLVVIGALILGVILLLLKIAPMRIFSGSNPVETTPLLEKPAATAVSIYVEPFKEGDKATNLKDIVKYTGEGTWTVNISSNTPIKLSWGWCATTKEILDQNLQNMQIEFIIDGMNVSKVMSEREYSIEGGLCHVYEGIIRTWPLGQHMILYKMVFLQKVNDGEADFEGENNRTYIINVAP